MKINEIIVRPLLTEKGTILAKEKTYMFEVSKKANKNQIRETIEKLYNVKVEKIRVMRRKGKQRRVGKRMKTKKLPDLKIAFVSIKQGAIDLFPQA